MLTELCLNATEQIELKRLLKEYIKETDITISDSGGEFYEDGVPENLLCAHNILHKIDPAKHKLVTRKELDEKYRSDDDE